MKVLFIFSCLLLVVWAQRSRLDNVDIDNVLQNNRLVENYFKCVTGKKPCTSEANEFKKLIPNILDGACEKCTDSEKVKVEKLLKFLVKERPEWWKELLEIYDPKGEYQSKHQDKLDAILNT